MLETHVRLYCSEETCFRNTVGIVPRAATTPYPITCLGHSTGREELYVCTILIPCPSCSFGFFFIFLEENKLEEKSASGKISHWKEQLERAA